MAKNNMMQKAGIALVILVILVIVFYKPQTSAPDQGAQPPATMAPQPQSTSSEGNLKLAETDIVMSDPLYDIDLTVTNTRSSPAQFLMGIRCTDLVGSQADKDKLNTGRFIRFETKPVLDAAPGASVKSVLTLSADDDAPATTYSCMVQASLSSGNMVETYSTATFKITKPQ